ncbi:MAG: FMN-binding protein [Acholeplasma sp.]|nr:MAG: FMN-binding protein [Acholeplasma sp.]
MKKILIVFISVFFSLIVLAFLGISWLQKDLSATKDLVVPMIDMDEVQDGTYLGKYENGRFSTSIEVVVSDHIITEVNVIDDVTFKKEDVTQSLIDQVIQHNGLDVDGISGATATVNAYLMAIHNALNQGENAWNIHSLFIVVNTGQPSHMQSI